MNKLIKSIVPLIESVYESLTPTEKDVADYFINNRQIDQDFSSQRIATTLHVSEATLTRFSQKVGFSGYREFIYAYSNNQFSQEYHYQNKNIRRVLHDYHRILDKTYSLLDSEQIERFVNRITNAERIYIYGKGSSGIAATEVKYRFMRMGLSIEAITDDDLMLINHVVLNEKCVVVGFSISGQTTTVINALRQAAKKGVYTVLFTTQMYSIEPEAINEIFPVASVQNLSYGNRISPQFPLLVINDIIFDYMLEANSKDKGRVFDQSLKAFEDLERT